MGMPDLFKSFMEGYNGSKERARQQEQDAAREEQRKLEMDILRHTLKEKQIQAKMEALKGNREAQVGQVQSKTGQDNPVIDTNDAFMKAFSGLQNIGVQAPTSSNNPALQNQAANAPVTIKGWNEQDAWGNPLIQPDVQMEIPTGQEVIEKTLQDQLAAQRLKQQGIFGEKTAEAAAKFPYEQQLEQSKSLNAANALQQKQEYDANQSQLDRVNRLDAAKVRGAIGGGTPVAIPVLTGATQAEKLSQIPADDRAMVEAMITYRRAPVGGFATRDPYWKKLLSMANQVDPGYNEAMFPARSKILSSFTSGRDYRQIIATNTLANHLWTLNEAALALKNKDVQKLNAVANRVGVEVGADPVTTLRTIVHRVGPEVTQAYVGTGGEFSERKENEGDFGETMSPAQLLSNIGVTAKLLEGKIISQADQWKTNMGRKEFAILDGGPGFVTPQAQQIFDTLNKQYSGGTSVPSGPKAGSIVNGYKFKGGDPNNKANWTKE
jgi:hypothetical protein